MRPGALLIATGLSMLLWAVILAALRLVLLHLGVLV